MKKFEDMDGDGFVPVDVGEGENVEVKNKNLMRVDREPDDFMAFRIFDYCSNRFLEGEHGFFIRGDGQVAILWESNPIYQPGRISYRVDRSTGFRDMNGKLVYENDVVTSWAGKRYLVSFSKTSGCFVLFPEDSCENIVVNPDISCGFTVVGVFGLTESK